MKYQLNGTEARVIGCLLEKQVTTPEQYPLSVNAVTMACNQKTNREPVMNLSEHEVQDVLDALVKRHYLRTVSGFGNRVTKYEQRFCNSEFGDLKLSRAEVAVITTLLLRGAQTPGELRARASRMHEFSDMAEVEPALEGLATREDGPYVVRLAREPGKRESRYMHLFSGDVQTLVNVVEAVSPPEESLVRARRGAGRGGRRAETASGCVAGTFGRLTVKKLRVGVVGLGGIAQKAWLPVLGAATDWTLQGAWSPTREKAERVCETWRIPYAASLTALARECDAVFRPYLNGNPLSGGE